MPVGTKVMELEILFEIGLVGGGGGFTFGFVGCPAGFCFNIVDLASFGRESLDEFLIMDEMVDLGIDAHPLLNQGLIRKHILKYFRSISEPSVLENTW